MTPTAKQLVDALVALQEEKERAYGVDWKRFGLVSSLFNVYRKFIRLRTIWDRGWQPTSDDTRLDTIVDLLNYLILSVILHAELFPREFDSVILKHSNNLFDPVILKRQNNLAAQAFCADERGFKRFAYDVLGQGNKDYNVSSLNDSVPSIIRLGESTIEEWLQAVAEIAEELGNGQIMPRRAVRTTVLDARMRLANLVDLIYLCLAAALRHAQDCPEEWERLTKRYALKS
jgi:hypothetical protein